MSVAEDLGKLIIMLNPYTKGAEDGMDPHTFAPATPSTTPTAAGETTPESTASSGNPRGIWMEIDTKYADDWTFKGQPHSISKALRIAYRWPKKEGNKVLYYVTDYLLIGFEGSNGGG